MAGGKDDGGYLKMKMLARKYPEHFVKLLGEVLRLELQAEARARKRQRPF
jgi:hypothetical protein